ncbi:MAG TPA: hypothetical protein VGF45_16695 [Polyangia bacterium]
MTKNDVARVGAQRLTGSIIPVCALFCLGASCDVETLFSANFEADANGAPPASAQSVGTVRVQKGGGSVIVVPSPVPVTTPDKWVRISHPTATTPETSFIVDATRTPGDGTNSLLATLMIPAPGPRPNPAVARALATVQFESALPGGQSAAFMHLDFMDTGTIRIDDDPNNTVGSFPFGEPFTLAVSNEVTPSAATAHISLLSPAEGQTDHPIDFVSTARRFNSVRFWVGFQFASTFFVDDITMLHAPPAP